MSEPVLTAVERVLVALEKARVRYVVVGGVAAVLHGRMRTTADLDLMVALDHENALRAIRALQSLGYRPRVPVPAEEFANADARTRWVTEKGLVVFSLFPEHPSTLTVDLFATEPIPFEDAMRRATAIPLETMSATVISIDDLITLKRQAGRHRDLDDVEALEEIRRDNERDRPPEEQT